MPHDISPSTVILVVLGAAILHAVWNALVKSGGDPYLRLAIVNLAQSVIVLPILPFVPVPDAAAWPWLIASVFTHLAYYVFLSSGYRIGDLSHLYPIARGVAPPLVAVGGIALQGEWLSPAGTLALTTICAGIWLLARTGRSAGAKPLLLALATGTMIGIYSVCDGLGARLSGDVLGYIAWLFILDGWPFAVIIFWMRRGRLGEDLRRAWLPSMFGGLFSVTAYGLVIWAMTQMPLAHVSALRETSVVIAALIGARLLGEPFGNRRLVSAVIVSAGVAILHLSR